MEGGEWKKKGYRIFDGIGRLVEAQTHAHAHRGGWGGDERGRQGGGGTGELHGVGKRDMEHRCLIRVTV